MTGPQGPVFCYLTTNQKLSTIRIGDNYVKFYEKKL